MTQSSSHLGDLQLAILQVLWRRSEATVSQVHADLWEERHLAPTTIATMLSKMEQKGVITHRREGRRFIYSAELVEGEVRRNMVSDLLDRVFKGDATALVSHLLHEGEIDPLELAHLKAQISRARDIENDPEEPADA